MRTTLSLALLAFCTSASAAPWHTIGPRAMGMGGASVALAQGPLASYWNPGALGQLYNTNGLAIPFGLRGEFTGTVLQGANDLNQLISDCNALNANCTQANVNNALTRFGQAGNGALLNGGGGVEIKIGRAVFFAHNFTDIGANPQVDLVNVNVPPGANLVTNNQSKLVLRGGSFTEFGIGYGREIGKTGLSVGANLKGIVGKIGYYALPILTERPGGGSFTKFDKGAKTSFQPALDLGALWDMRESFPILPMRPRWGIVARNVNNPTFAQPDAAKAAGGRSRYSLEGQVRTGVALSPLQFWNITADADLTENLTPVEGFKSRFVGAGTEINVFNRTWINIPLRAGLQKNVAAGQNSGVSYTAGFGLNFLHLVVDIGGMVSSKTTVLQSQGKSEKIPNNFALAGQVAFFFGGEDEGVRN